jgi:hypothetical protein
MQNLYKSMDIIQPYGKYAKSSSQLFTVFSLMANLQKVSILGAMVQGRLREQQVVMGK